MNYLITGGTGSFGQAMAARLLANPNTESVRIFSRGELRQAQMKEKFARDWERIRFFIGDVRDKERLLRAMRGVDVVFHAAALKRIEVAEYNPYEAIKTNVAGSHNVVDCAVEAQVRKCVLISSDKAVDPANTYGASKMLAERIFSQAPYFFGDPQTDFLIVRYGNVAGSNGSVIPLFKVKAANGEPLPITHNDMTRFIIKMDEALDLVEQILNEGESGEIFIKKLPALSVLDLANTINFIFRNKAGLRLDGIGPGEKVHECLVSLNELNRTFDYEDHFIIVPLMSNKERRESHEVKEPFSSDKARRMTKEEIMKLIGGNNEYSGVA
jgi:FlaA1/EpsC-like NDP-sugar epimerase